MRESTQSKNPIHSCSFQVPDSPGTPNSGFRKWGLNCCHLNWPNNRFIKSIFLNGWMYCTILGLIVSFRRIQLWKPQTHRHNKEESINPSTSLSYSECTVCYHGKKSRPLTERHRVFPTHVYNSAPKAALCSMFPPCWGKVKLVSSYMKALHWKWVQKL